MPADPRSAPEGAARRTALAVVLRCLSGAFLSRALGDELGTASLSGQDRSLVTELSYGTLRHLIALRKRLDEYLSDPDELPPAVRGALVLGAYELLHRGTPPYAAVSAWVDVAKDVSARHAKLVNAVLRRVSQGSGQESPGSADAERDLSLPPWLFEAFAESLGHEAAVVAARGMLEPEPLWLTAFSPEARRSLEAQGVEVRPGPDLRLPHDVPAREWPTTLSVRSPLPLHELDAFRSGLVQPQNPSSLYAAKLLGAGEGELVYDLAAGHGVKTATLVASGARVVAVELSEKRARLAKRNLERLGMAAEHVIGDLIGGWPPPETEPAGRVLLDAPCSGTGTLRGNPEIKLRLNPEDVERLAAAQAAMLASAVKALAPGGTLVYAVCSLTPAEGVGQVARLLAERPDLEEAPLPAERQFAKPDGPGTYLLPSGGLDGFYLARLRRRGG